MVNLMNHIDKLNISYFFPVKKNFVLENSSAFVDLDEINKKTKTLIARMICGVKAVVLDKVTYDISKTSV